MTVQEYNDNTNTLINMLEVQQAIAKAGNSLKEFQGKWDELLEDRESYKQDYDYLFSELTHSAFPLAAKNRLRITKLKKTSYPLLLCGLAKCYLETERLKDAEAVLLEAKSLGSQGAEVLLFLLYIKSKDSERLADSFNRVKTIDIFSETVTAEIDNDFYQCSAVSWLSQFYRAIDNNPNKAYRCLVRALDTDLLDNCKEHIRKLLSHYRETSRGNYTYVE